MFRFPGPVTLHLEPGQTLAFRHLRARLAVRTGAVHLTRRGDATDHFLQAGSAMDLHGSTRIVLEPARPDEPAVLVFAAPDRWRPAGAVAWLRRFSA